MGPHPKIVHIMWIYKIKVDNVNTPNWVKSSVESLSLMVERLRPLMVGSLFMVDYTF